MSLVHVVGVLGEKLQKTRESYLGLCVLYAPGIPRLVYLFINLHVVYIFMNLLTQ